MTIRKYRVREGFSYGAFSQHTAGMIVELDEDAAKHAMDKLELAEIVQNVPAAPAEPPPAPEAPEPEDHAPITDETGIEQPSLPYQPKRTLKKSKTGD